MQLPVGEYIRQLRRQRSLTQTELGGTRFSKSYVSAVERDKIAPSHDALRFFAEQLDQPIEPFEQLLQQTEQIKQIPSALSTNVTPIDDQNDQEIVALLDLVLKGKEHYHTPLPQIIANLPLETNTFPSLQKQARYTFLKGLQAQENSDLTTAQVYLEHALALASTEYLPSILDALGTNYYLSQAFECALGYHMRALKLLKANNPHDHNLLLSVELHCANDYRALQTHYEAGLHYEQARRYLRATHNMQIAGELYLGLGYCIYASLFQAKTSPHAVITTQLSAEEMDRSYQLALNFLLQSRTLYQVSSDQEGESTARLTQAMVLLDFSAWRQHIAQEKTRVNGKTVPFMNCSSLLDDAEEQCHQVLLGWQETLTDFTVPSTDQQTILYTALAYLTRVFTQRAVLARIGEYYDTATKERSLAIHICQQILDSLQEQALPWRLVHDIANLSGVPISYRSQSLPYSADLSAPLDHNPIIAAEVFFAAGEIAEELGKVSTSPEYAQECYSRSDHFFQLTLEAAHLEVPNKKRDSSYLTRLYQRYTNVLEQRLMLNSPVDTTSQKLLSVFKNALLVLQRPALAHESMLYNL
jgi:transcriptional regulator with XRE-family HTH domain